MKVLIWRLFMYHSGPVCYAGKNFKGEIQEPLVSTYLYL